MTASLLESFVAEARELLQSTAAALLVLEKHSDDQAAINDVFRSVHTLKGSAGLFDFPALSKLISAGEDVLSAVRDGRIDLTPALVDMLLDTLDQVSAWVDGIAAAGTLPAGAEGASREMTAGLRAVLPDDHGNVGSDTSGTTVADLTRLDWLATLPETDRLAAFAAGADILALEYVPIQDCFFSGEDPFILFRQLAGLHSLQIESTEPWPTLDKLDAYRCILRFRALTSAPRHEVETLFRYVVEQVRVVTVPPNELISLTGDPSGEQADPVFLEQARRLISDADWPAFRLAANARLARVDPSALESSALRWLLAVSCAAVPDSNWAAALVDCIATGDAALHWAPSRAENPSASGGPGDVIPDAAALPPLGTLPAMAERILRAQGIMLRLGGPPGGLATRLDSVSRTVANLLSASAAKDSCRIVWADAVAACVRLDDIRPVLVVLDHWLPVDQSHRPATAAMSLAGDQPRSSQSALGPSATSDTKSAHRVLKVDQGKIDMLMNLIGELVVSKNSLPFLARRAEQVHGSREMAREIKDLHVVIDRLAQEMQGAIMAVRMLPVSDVFERFPRLVRDVARKLGKQIDLVIEGADTAADKNMIEALNEPLLHIVRNAIDHGIETPEDRDDVGKPTRAVVLLRAFQESDQVVIEVVDDGRGIDPETIKRSALSKGIIDEQRAASLTDQEAVNLVFTPGFSTVSQVSELSGRGVGMDVVMNGVRKAGGSVAIRSVKDAGTTVRLSLPLSMAVTRVMVVEAAGGMLFGIPMDQIAETVRVHRDDVRKLKQSEAFVLRDAIVPLIRLDRLLGIEPLVWFGDGNEEDAVLVVRSGASLAGLVVDQFHEGMDIILKPFDGFLSHILGYSGSALLGDGRVLLVLNLKELL